MINASRSAQRSLATQLQSGDTRLSDWQRSMIDQIKQTQIAAALAANGGDENSSKVDYKEIAATILALLFFFRGFSKDIEAGKQPLNGFLFLRSDLYANAARSTFEEIRRYGMATYFGAAQEKRELGPAEHCRTHHGLKGCVELHDLGWVPINTLARLGQTPCRTHCKCRFIYRYLNDIGNWIIVDDSATIAVILRELKVRQRAI